MSRSRRVTLRPVNARAGGKDGNFASGMELDLVADDQLRGGIGMWTTVNRPRRRDAIEWAGTSGYSYVLPLLLDGTEQSIGVDRSVEPECRRLLAWSGEATRTTDEPTVLLATGPLKTPPNVRWVITDLAWGGQIRNGNGNRVQQYVTVTLIQHTAPTIRKSPAKKVRDDKDRK